MFRALLTRQLQAGMDEDWMSGEKPPHENV